MPNRPASTTRALRSAVRQQLLSPSILAFLPALSLAAYWFGGETAMLVMALIVPGMFAFSGILRIDDTLHLDIDDITKLPHRNAVMALLDTALPRARAVGRSVGTMVVIVDNFDDAMRDFKQSDQDDALLVVADRICGCLRGDDRSARLEGPRFALALPMIRRADHALMVDIAKRLQRAVAEPISITGQRVHLTLSVGFCLPGNLESANGNALIEAAEAALAVSRAQGGGAIRGYDSEMVRITNADKSATEDLMRAMDAGEIVPWFQPQAHTASGEIIGFEALARWMHPERGVIMPNDFLPLIEPAGLTRRLGEVMLFGSLSLLRSLDRQGLYVPYVAVNFSHAELAAPDLAERIRWELDRFDLEPRRLSIEVLETALAHDTTTVERNLRALSDLGCGIDLDDFGTGNTSIAGIRRFAISRLKIDRSFVTGVDHDSEQSDMVRAIQTMARQLKLTTLAEGVETEPERTSLASLGCEAVQGFFLSRPIQPQDVGLWLTSHDQGLAAHVPVSASTTAPNPLQGIKTTATQASTALGQGKTA